MRTRSHRIGFVDGPDRTGLTFPSAFLSPRQLRVEAIGPVRPGTRFSVVDDATPAMFVTPALLQVSDPSGVAWSHEVRFPLLTVDVPLDTVPGFYTVDVRGVVPTGHPQCSGWDCDMVFGDDSSGVPRDIRVNRAFPASGRLMVEVVP
jgi:hypothetical protein